MDYRKFLGAKQTAVLPYLGGRSVYAPSGRVGRRLRVTTRVAVGWWRFSIEGRNATATEPAEPPDAGDMADMTHLPRVSGHLVSDWLLTSGELAERIHLMPEDEPPVLSPVTARRWASDAVFEGLQFEGEAEDTARQRLLADGTLADLKGVVPSLRAAFGYARILRAARPRGLTLSLHEVMSRVNDVANGSAAADAVLDAIEARIFQADPESAHRERARPREDPRARPSRPEDVEDRAFSVLEAAGAEPLSGRQLGGGSYEVTFRYAGQQFIAVVDASTLHVYDSGICLDGHDELLGLDALPSVIAEAIADHALVITRR